MLRDGEGGATALAGRHTGTILHGGGTGGCYSGKEREKNMASISGETGLNVTLLKTHHSLEPVIESQRRWRIYGSGERSGRVRNRGRASRTCRCPSDTACETLWD